MPPPARRFQFASDPIQPGEDPMDVHSPHPAVVKSRCGIRLAGAGTFVDLSGTCLWIVRRCWISPKVGVGVVAVGSETHVMRAGSLTSLQAHGDP